MSAPDVMTPAPNVPPIEIDSLWLPKANSTMAASSDYAMGLVYTMSIVFFVGIMVAMFYLARKYKRRTDTDVTEELDHSTKIEIIWSAIPMVLVLWLFWVGFKGYVAAHVAPTETYDINVTAQMWSWNFTYPNGRTCPQLAVPKGKPVKLILSSQDVLHSLFIPTFRVKQDAVPGNYTTMWFEANEAGETALECTEYCGKDHSAMLTTVKVLEDADFKAWIKSCGRGDLPPAQIGKEVFDSKCKSCHSLDGSRVQGPSFKGLWAKGEEEFADGSKAKIDENYIRESILVPSSKVVKGYPNVMTPFKGLLSDEEVNGVIAFLKEQK